MVMEMWNALTAKTNLTLVCAIPVSECVGEIGMDS